MRLRPLGKHLLILPESPREKTESGILLTSLHNIKAEAWGKVVAVGPEVSGIDSGDRIFFRMGDATLVALDGVPHLLLTSEPKRDITLAVVSAEEV